VYEGTKLDCRGVPQAGVPHAGAAANPQSNPHPLADDRLNRARRRSNRPTRPVPHDPQAEAPNEAEAKVGAYDVAADPQFTHPVPVTTIGAGSAAAIQAELSSKRDAFIAENLQILEGVSATTHRGGGLAVVDGRVH